MSEIPSSEMGIAPNLHDNLADKHQLDVVKNNISSTIDDHLGIVMGEVSEPRSKSVAGWFLTGKMQMGGFVLFNNHKSVLILVNEFSKEDKDFLENTLNGWGETYTCSLDKKIGLPTKLPKTGDFSFDKVRQAVLGNQMLGGVVGNLNPYQ